MLIIAAVIVSWMTGLWSCDTGRKDLTEEEKLTIADYINSISVLVQHSNKISVNFFIALDDIKELSREDLEITLSDIIEESKVVYQNCEELNPPEGFDVPHGYLRLLLRLRSEAYNDFKPALENSLQDIDIEIASSQMKNAFLNMHMSDELYRYFQEELAKSGQNIEIGDLTILDSEVLQDKGLIEANNVNQLITDIKTVTDLQERRGVAVLTDTIEFDPPMINQQDEYLILSSGNNLSISIEIENQGNVTERDLLVKMIYKNESNPHGEEKTFNISSIDPSEKKLVTISGFTVYPGDKCVLEIEAVPVPNEAYMANNNATFKFLIEE